MRVYYTDKGIAKVTRDFDPLPEDSPKTAINIPYSVIEIDEAFNRELCFKLIRNKRGTEDAPMPDRFRVENGQLIDNDTNEVATVSPNPQKESFKLSLLYSVTPEQAKTYIQNQVNAISNLTQAKAFLSAYLPEVAAAIVWLARQSKLED